MLKIQRWIARMHSNGDAPRLQAPIHTFPLKGEGAGETLRFHVTQAP
jgi:hypothetical protein